MRVHVVFLVLLVASSCGKTDRSSTSHAQNSRTYPNNAEELDAVAEDPADRKPTIPFARSEWIAGGGLVPLENGDLLAYLYCHIADGGVQVLGLRATTGEPLWLAECAPLVNEYSAYQHDATLKVRAGHIEVTSKGSHGTFVETLDLKSGKQIGRILRDRP